MNKLVLILFSVFLISVGSCTVQQRIDRLIKKNPIAASESFDKVFPPKSSTKVITDTLVYLIEGKDSIITIDCDSVTRSLDRYALYNKANSVVKIPYRVTDTIVKTIKIDSIITQIDSRGIDAYKQKIAKLQEDNKALGSRSKILLYISIGASLLVLLRFFFR